MLSGLRGAHWALLCACRRKRAQCEAQHAQSSSKPRAWAPTPCLSLATGELLLPLLMDLSHPNAGDSLPPLLPYLEALAAAAASGGGWGAAPGNMGAAAAEAIASAHASPEPKQPRRSQRQQQEQQQDEEQEAGETEAAVTAVQQGSSSLAVSSPAAAVPPVTAEPAGAAAAAVPLPAALRRERSIAGGSDGSADGGGGPRDPLAHLDSTATTASMESASPGTSLRRTTSGTADGSAAQHFDAALRQQEAALRRREWGARERGHDGTAGVANGIGGSLSRLKAQLGGSAGGQATQQQGLRGSLMARLNRAGSRPKEPRSSGAGDAAQRPNR